MSEQVIIALISAGGGAILLKLFDIFFLSKKSKVDVAIEFRDELREALREQKKDINRLEGEVDKCKMRCYRLLEIIALHGIQIPDELRGQL